MIRDGYTEFGRQIAITIVNVLVFAIEKIVGIFFQLPELEQTSSINSYVETSNRRNDPYINDDYYHPSNHYYGDRNLIPYKEYEYETMKYLLRKNGNSKRKLYL